MVEKQTDSGLGRKRKAQKIHNGIRRKKKFQGGYILMFLLYILVLVVNAIACYFVGVTVGKNL